MLLLASTYSPETESVDYDVNGINQFVLDESYDLHQYTCNFPTGLTDVIQTDVPHIFDVPGAENVVHEVSSEHLVTTQHSPDH